MGSRINDSASEQGLEVVRGKGAWEDHRKWDEPLKDPPDKLSWSQAVDLHNEHMGEWGVTKWTFSALLGVLISPLKPIFGTLATALTSLGNKFEQPFKANLDDPMLSDEQVRKEWQRMVEWFGEGRVVAPERVMDLGLSGYYGEKLRKPGMDEDIGRAEEDAVDDQDDPGKLDKMASDPGITQRVSESEPSDGTPPPKTHDTVPPDDKPSEGEDDNPSPDEPERSDWMDQPTQDGDIFPPDEIQRSDWMDQPTQDGDIFPPDEIQQSDWMDQPTQDGDIFPPDEIQQSDWMDQPTQDGDIFPPDQIDRSDEAEQQDDVVEDEADADVDVPMNISEP